MEECVVYFHLIAFCAPFLCCIHYISCFLGPNFVLTIKSYVAVIIRNLRVEDSLCIMLNLLVNFMCSLALYHVYV